MAFHERLKQSREKTGMTQAEIANLLGIAKSTYSGYETGKSEPSMSAIANIMKILEVSPDFLWQDETEGLFNGVSDENPCDSHKQEIQSQEEIELLDLYHSLNTQAKAMLLETARAFAGNPSMQKDGLSSQAM